MLAHMVADEPVKSDAGAVRLAADGSPGGLVVVVEPSACWTVPASTSLNIGDPFRQAPMTGPATVNLGVAVSLRGLSYPSPKTAPRKLPGPGADRQI
jgi:hypothetical protein